MINKHEIINSIIKEKGYYAYLEIGCQFGYNLKRIECDHKVGVDPDHVCDYRMNSDEFFAHNENNFDCIFIDGLHHADQVRKDIRNAMRCLSPDGCIILHDSIPKTEEEQQVPRIQRTWVGTVWRAVVGFIESYPDVKVETYRSDHGLTIIYPEGKKVRKNFEDMNMSYEEFKSNEVSLLNIID